MGRRKALIYGRSLDGRFDIALGFPDYSSSGTVLADAGFEIPKIDWSVIARKFDYDIPKHAIDEIDFAFENEVGFWLRKAITQKLSGELPQGDVPEADFNMKAERIELLARRLTKEIDEQTEIGTMLIVRPKRKDGLTSAETPSKFYQQVTGKTDSPSSVCFFDYYSFRKLLDYYANFSAQNGGFNSVIGRRFGRAHDYSWYETFVRRVVLAFWPTNFPMTVTIPTDTNPDFESPVILVLEELRAQFNQLASEIPALSGLYQDWTYRQHARLVLKLRVEFEKSGIFWALSALRQYDSDQSEFPEF